tara:strand:+ start:200 stop:514 length:315 start_codon:yes stop_codon:yes gene_type:complete
VTRKKICDISDLEDAVPRKFEIDGKKLAVVLIEGKIFAIGDTCSHADVSLSEGELDAEELAIECWKHGSLFSLETGRPLCLPATKPVESYEVDLVGSDVLVVLV